MQKTHTEKAKAMMAARLLAEVEAAPTLNNELARTAAQCANTLALWVTTSPNTSEAVTAGAIALRRLRHINQNLALIKSNLVLKSASGALAEATNTLKAQVHARYAVMDARETPTGAWSSLLDDEDEAYIGGGEDGGSLSGGEGGGKLLPRDVQHATEKGTTQRSVLWCLLCVIVLAGAVTIIMLNQSAYKSAEEAVERKITIEMALIVQCVLNVLYDAMTAAGADIKHLGPTTAATVLFDMSSRTGAAQDVLKLNTNHLTEYRGAVQDFSKSSQVTDVLTERAYGGICQTNITFRIHRDDDVFANQSYVFPAMTPNMCANDATNTGLFSHLVPSYIRYTSFVTTYRRNAARLATFYHSGFGLSVAVTHDRQTLQEFLMPAVTLLGDVERFLDNDGECEQDLAMWCGLVLGVSVVLMFLVVLWMMATTVQHWKGIFYVVVFLTVGGTLTAVLLVAQAVFAAAMNRVLLLAVTSMTEAVVGGVLSETMMTYGASDVFIEKVTKEILPNRVFVTDHLMTSVHPSFMTEVAKTIDAGTISSYQRGQYSEISHGYAISSTFLNFTDMNVFVVRKLDKAFKADINIAVILAAACIAVLVAYCYLHWSPLVRLRSLGVGSSFMLYKMKGSGVRSIFYGVFIIFSIVGIVGSSGYAVTQVHEVMRDLAGDTLILIGSMLRTPGIVDVTYDNKGMPDFIVPLYFTQKFELETDEYPTISVVEYDISLPFPPREDWAANYMGSQLSLMNIFTSIFNVPAFYTPLVNTTTNITDPRYMKRNMLATLGINTTAAFSLERFPSSYFPTTFQYIAHSIGFCVIFLLVSIAVIVIEWQYVGLHERFHRGQSLVLPYVVICCVVFLVFVGFIAHGGVLKPIMQMELQAFAEKELGIAASLMSTRFQQLAHELKGLPRDELVKALANYSESVSLSAMLMGTKFGRIRLAPEYSHRGSGLLTVPGMPNSDPVNLGPLDRGYLPVCGKVDAQYVSNYVKGETNYCFVEILQMADDVDEPRLFIIAATSLDAWVGVPLGELWPSIFGLTVLIGFLSMLGSYVILFLSMHACHATGYGILDGSHTVESTCPGLPASLPKEFFMPRHHRQFWMASFVLVGLIIMYFSMSSGNFVEAMNEYYDIFAPYQTQSTKFQQLNRKALAYSYSYIIFPVTAATTNEMLSIRNSAASGATGYNFVDATSLKMFQDALYQLAMNLTSTNYVLADVLQCADRGYGSFASLLSYEYQNAYITSQDDIFTYFAAVETAMESVAGGSNIVDYPAFIDALHELIISRELMRKLYILDHMAIGTYGVSPASGVAINWPFPQDLTTIVVKTDAAAVVLQGMITKSLNNLETKIAAATTSVVDGLINPVERIMDNYKTYIALNNMESQVWEVQSSRLTEVFLSENSTIGEVAASQQKNEVAGVWEATEMLSDAMKAEMTTRKTMQLREYLQTGEPVETVLVKAAFQRWDEHLAVRRKYITGFACTMAGYAVVSVCILLHFALLRKKTDLTLKLKQQEKRMTEKEARHHRSSDRTSSAYSKRVTSSGKGSKRKLSESKGSSLMESLDTEMKQREDLMLVNSVQTHEDDLAKKDHLKPEETVGQVEQLDDEEEDFDETGNAYDGVAAGEGERRAREPPRRQQWVLRPVAACLVITAIPLVCAFWLITLHHKFIDKNLYDVAVVLNLYQSALDAMTYIDQVIIQSAKYYTGAISEDEYNYFMDTFDDKLNQLIGAYRWGLHLQVSAYVASLQNAYDTVRNILEIERQRFKDQTSLFDMRDYYTPQSAYPRSVLVDLKSDNTYGVAMPMGATTDGSAVNAFAEAAYTTASTEAAAAGLTSGDFLKVYSAYSSAATALDRISDAELQLWHAVVAGARNNGASTAVGFSQFHNLVDEAALSALVSSSEPTAAAAKTAVDAYYDILLNKTATIQNITDLFTNTTTAPTTQTTSTDAYLAAGFAGTVLSSTTSMALFANIYAYNRNLTSKSVLFDGSTTLVTALGSMEEAIQLMLSAIGNDSDVHVRPADRNLWLWNTEIYVTHSATRDHEDRAYLGLAVRWCCIASFWGLVITVFIVMYVTSLLSRIG